MNKGKNIHKTQIKVDCIYVNNRIYKKSHDDDNDEVIRKHIYTYIYAPEQR